jgi:hypothetical protein
MEINSSLLNEKEFSNVKKSLIQISEMDNKEKFRTGLIEYINDTADNNDDLFFFDMLPFVRFLNPLDEAVAYTTPDGLIYLNSPNNFIGENKRQWDFVYCHECLHQLWDTFAVGDHIKKELGSYDHNILNIASDCVINDYLYYYRRKDEPSDLITPKLLRDKYNVEYDRTEDTQYTLYLKLMEVKDKIKNDQSIQDIFDKFGDNDGEQQDGEGGQGGGPGGFPGKKRKGGGQGGGQGGGKDGQDQDGQGGGQDSNDDQDGQGGKGKTPGGQGTDEPTGVTPAGPGKGKDGQDGQGGGQDGGQDGQDGGQDGKGKGGKNSQTPGGKGQGHGEGDKTTYDPQIKKQVEEIVEKYKNTLSGALGKFLEQCKQSVKCNKQGINVNTSRGALGWDKKLKTKIISYIKEQIFNKQRRYKKTYQRYNRRAGVVKFDGSPLVKGKKKIEELLMVDLAFYIDKSGSMSDCIDNVFDSYDTIAAAVTKLCKGNSIVSGIKYKTFVFDDSISEIPFGKRCHASGGTCDFDKILNYINKHTKDILINCIITDAEFGIDKAEVRKFINDLPGLVIVVTNTDNNVLKSLSNEADLKTKLIYILADKNFTI